MNLQLSLKTKWFEMTKSGDKTEDYREITPYWVKRICGGNELSVFMNTNGHDESYTTCNSKKFTTNTMTLGYPKSTDTSRIIKFEHGGIEIREGNPEWGAEEGKIYFVIKHGKQIK